MQVGSNTGWRRLPPSPVALQGDKFSATRSEIFKAKKLADQALGLSKASIAVLGALISFYKEPLNGRLLVWPSNESLSEATGYSDRAVRAALADLVSKGLLLPKDSANGKRFSIRFSNGQVKDAFGFDLSPLIDREQEFAVRVSELREIKDQIRREYDNLTICRRSVEQVICAFEDYYPEIDIAPLRARYAELRAITPRRSTDRAPGAVCENWIDLKALAESQYSAASAGNSRRLIEDNKNTPDQSCQNGNEQEKGQSPITIADLGIACPDAMEVTSGVRTEHDLVAAALRMRGTYGTSRDAWNEACASIGAAPAAVAFMMVLQIWADDQKNKATIMNMGGLYRATVRRVAAGELDLVAEIHKMKRRRRH